jgi:hypothetical protein
MDAWKFRVFTAYLSNMDPKRKFRTARSLISLSIGYRAYLAIVMSAISTIAFTAGIGTINAVQMGNCPKQYCKKPKCAS